MRETLNERCRLFIENRDAAKSAFPMESSYMYAICASYFMNKGVVATTEGLKEAKAILKSRANMFSGFRGTVQLSIVAMLALEENKEKCMDDAMAIYALLKKKFVFSSDYLPVAAIMVARSVPSEKWEEVVERSRRIYDLMKAEHPFLTSSEDCVFAVMLAMSPRGDDDMIRNIETCYNILKDRFSDKNAVQSLYLVLSLTDSDSVSISDKCRDTIRLFDLLKEKKHKYGAGYALSTLGVLATLPCGIDETVRDIIEVSDFLKTQKGYGFFGFDRTERMMHAGMIVTSDHLGSSEAMENAAVNSTVSLIAAQQALMCAVISVSLAASATAMASSR